MSALARYFLAVGKKVSGSDSVETIITKELENEGVVVILGHREENICDDIDLVVYTQAIPKGNKEVKAAKKKNKVVISYAEALGLLTKEKYTIAVAGTHGKSTTTAMIALMMEQAGLDPTVIIGTRIKEFGDTNFRFGKSNFLLMEACEYRRSFLEYMPTIVVLPNVELDHLDYFENEEDYVDAFKTFVKKIPESGVLVCNDNDKNINKLYKSMKGDIIPLQFSSQGFLVKKQKYEFPHLQIPGMHNKINASLAFFVGKVLQIPETVILDALASFSGTWRRFERKGVLKSGAICFDDYGHHPTEITATLRGVREMFPKKRIICVFQPHQYSRTRHFLSDFGHAFSDADEVIIPNIYEARDTTEDKTNMNVDILVQEIQKHHKAVVNGQNIAKTASYLLEYTDSDTVIITMGAGDISSIYAFLRIF